MTHRVLKSHRSKMSVIYVVKRQTMCPPGYYQSANGLMVAHALGHMMYGYTLLVPMLVHIAGTHLTSVGFEHSVCHESLLTSFIMLLA